MAETFQCQCCLEILDVSKKMDTEVHTISDDSEYPICLDCHIEEQQDFFGNDDECSCGECYMLFVSRKVDAAIDAEEF